MLDVIIVGGFDRGSVLRTYNARHTAGEQINVADTKRRNYLNKRNSFHNRYS